MEPCKAESISSEWRAWIPRLPDSQCGSESGGTSTQSWRGEWNSLTLDRERWARDPTEPWSCPSSQGRSVTWGTGTQPHLTARCSPTESCPVRSSASAASCAPGLASAPSTRWQPSSLALAPLRNRLGRVLFPQFRILRSETVDLPLKVVHLDVECLHRLEVVAGQ